MRQGLFSIFLDGFDEIKHDRREYVEKELLRLCYSYPKAHVIVSSRPNETFKSWEEFSVFPIRAMSLDQINKLVNNIEYDQSVKEKFVSALSNGIYTSHRTFLENPLLATMMLLTFDQIGEVPDKMHIFYDKCFDVLVREHDTTKAVFVREMYSKLTPEDFKQFFTFFSAITYYDSKYDFNEEELGVYVQKASEALQWDINTNNIIRDFTESASIMQKDGTNYVFAHRSFQEYFMSRFLIRCKSINLDKLIFPIQNRLFSDNVIRMAFDIDYEYMEQNFLMPNLKILSENIKNIDIHNYPKEFFQLFFCELYIVDKSEEEGRFSYVIDGTENSFFVILYILEHIYYPHKGLLPKKPNPFQKKEFVTHDVWQIERHTGSIDRSVHIDEIEDEWFRKTYIANELAGLGDWILNATDVLEQHIRNRNKRLSDIIFN